jgi:hypothetical protein
MIVLASFIAAMLVAFVVPRASPSVGYVAPCSSTCDQMSVPPGRDVPQVREPTHLLSASAVNGRLMFQRFEPERTLRGSHDVRHPPSTDGAPSSGSK